MRGRGEGGLLPPSPGPPHTLHCPLSPHGTIILLGTCEQPFFPPGGGMSPTVRPPPLPSLASLPGQDREVGTGRLGRWQLPSCWDGAAPGLLCPGGDWRPPAPGDTSACLPHPPRPGRTPRHRAVHLHPDSGAPCLWSPCLATDRVQAWRAWPCPHRASRVSPTEGAALTPMLCTSRSPLFPLCPPGSQVFLSVTKHQTPSRINPYTRRSRHPDCNQQVTCPISSPHCRAMPFTSVFRAPGR